MSGIAMEYGLHLTGYWFRGEMTVCVWQQRANHLVGFGHVSHCLSCSFVDCGRRPAARMNKRILGGRTSRPGRWPWQCSLQSEPSGHICGCVLIAKKWVLTVAHCLEGWAAPFLFCFAWIWSFCHLGILRAYVILWSHFSTKAMLIYFLGLNLLRFFYPWCYPPMYMLLIYWQWMYLCLWFMS